MAGSEVTICRMIGEPYNKANYTDCVKCHFKTCPINRIFSILSKLAPEAINDIVREAEG